MSDGSRTGHPRAGSPQPATPSRRRSRPDAAIAAVEHFPGENPHPVMRIDERGRLVYANRASAPLLEALGVQVGDELRIDWLNALIAATAADRALELRVGPRTFELLGVRVETIKAINVYGTDVTAEKAIVKFPDQNPNPVFRITPDGALVYANPAAAELLSGIGASIGEVLPAAILERVLARARTADRETLDIVSGGRAYALLPVDVPEFGFINVYGTDTTAVRQLEGLYRENERLLLNILPSPIADRLRRGDALIADRFDDVSMMFADIVEFTRLSSGMTADEVVTILNDVFTVFDRLVDEADLEKVKTIGDAYMVVGGMPRHREDHLERIATMALALADAVARIETAARFNVRFRIGIHCGPVVAGVIGTKKWIYDVWGDTVNLASRMESTGVPGRIQVSAAVHERLHGQFRLEPRGLVEIKGKGELPTWFLVGPG